MICAPTRHDRIEREFRVLHHHREAPAAQPAPAGVGRARQVDARRRRAAARVTTPGGGIRPRIARARRRLAGARTRRRCQPLPAEREADVAHRAHVRRRDWDSSHRAPRPPGAGDRAHVRLRIEHVAQSVAQQVEAEADDEDGDARDGRDPPLVEDHVAAGWRPSRPIPASAAARRGRESRGRRR